MGRAGDEPERFGFVGAIEDFSGVGRTRVLVSHDVQGALAEADVVLRLKRGRPVADYEELYR